MRARLTAGLIAITGMLAVAACGGGGASVTQRTEAPAAKPVKDRRAAQAEKRFYECQDWAISQIRPTASSAASLPPGPQRDDFMKQEAAAAAQVLVAERSACLTLNGLSDADFKRVGAGNASHFEYVGRSDSGASAQGATSSTDTTADPAGGSSPKEALQQQIAKDPSKAAATLAQELGVDPGAVTVRTSARDSDWAVILATKNAKTLAFWLHNGEIVKSGDLKARDAAAPCDVREATGDSACAAPPASSASSGSSPATASGDGRYCGQADQAMGTVALGSSSCAFALKVANAYLAHPSSRLTVQSDSGERSTLRCDEAATEGPDENPSMRCVDRHGAGAEIRS